MGTYYIKDSLNNINKYENIDKVTIPAVTPDDSTKYTFIDKDSDLFKTVEETITENGKYQYPASGGIYKDIRLNINVPGSALSLTECEDIIKNSKLFNYNVDTSSNIFNIYLSNNILPNDSFIGLADFGPDQYLQTILDSMDTNITNSTWHQQFRTTESHLGLYNTSYEAFSFLHSKSNDVYSINGYNILNFIPTSSITWNESDLTTYGSGLPIVEMKNIWSNNFTKTQERALLQNGIYDESASGSSSLLTKQRVVTYSISDTGIQNANCGKLKVIPDNVDLSSITSGQQLILASIDNSTDILKTIGAIGAVNGAFDQGLFYIGSYIGELLGLTGLALDNNKYFFGMLYAPVESKIPLSLLDESLTGYVDLSSGWNYFYLTNTNPIEFSAEQNVIDLSSNDFYILPAANINLNTDATEILLQFFSSKLASVSNEATVNIYNNRNILKGK